MSHTVRDAYISVEIAHRGLECLRQELQRLLSESGVGCEIASRDAHVSIAYGEGDVAIEALEKVSEGIARLPFEAHVCGFEVFEGASTPFDYLVVNLEADASVGAAVDVVQGQMRIKNFDGGFRSHISLLKFSKSRLNHLWAQKVVNEMNACHQLARELDRPPVCLRGVHVSVFGADRVRCFSKSFHAA